MTDYTPLLHLPEVAPNQDQKEATINTALAILEAAMNDSLSVSLASGDVTLNTDQFTKYFHHVFTGNTVPRTVNVPATARWFSVENDGSSTITIQVTGAPGTTCILLAGKVGLIISDGTNLKYVVHDPMGTGALSDLSDVSGTPTDGQLLRWVQADGSWEPWTLSTTFLALSDTPSTYAGGANRAVTVNSGGTGLTFGSIVPTLLGHLADVETGTGTPTQGAFLRWIDGVWQADVFTPSGGGSGSTTFLGLTDTPSSFVGHANNSVTVNSGATALVFGPIVPTLLGHLADVETGTGTPAQGDFLRWIDGVWQADTVSVGGSGSGSSSFIGLTDVPASYVGHNNNSVTVNAGATGLTFGPIVPTLLGHLADVEAGTGTPAQGDFLRWIDGVWQADTFTVTGGGGSGSSSFIGLSDVPASYVGHANNSVTVNSGATGLTFGPIVPTLLGHLADVEAGTGTPGQGDFLRWVDGVWQADTYTPKFGFRDLTDAPSSYVGHANQAVVVNSGATGLTFGAIVPTLLGHLADVETGTGTPTQGDFLRYVDGVWQADTFRPAVGAITYFGSGAPSTLHNNGDIYFDTASTPYRGYVQQSGAWVAMWQNPFDVAVYVEAAPTSSERIIRFTATRACNFVGNLVGSVASASTAATGSTAFDVRKNGSSVGTITFAASATTATFVTSGGSAISLAINDYLEIFAPASPDATLKEIGFTLLGTRT